jgi:hypothetical protein
MNEVKLIHCCVHGSVRHFVTCDATSKGVYKNRENANRRFVIQIAMFHSA